MQYQISVTETSVIEYFKKEEGMVPAEEVLRKTKGHLCKITRRCLFCVAILTTKELK